MRTDQRDAGEARLDLLRSSLVTFMAHTIKGRRAEAARMDDLTAMAIEEETDKDMEYYFYILAATAPGAPRGDTPAETKARKWLYNKAIEEVENNSGNFIRVRD